MSLIRWEPFRALRRRDDAFDDLFREFFHRPMVEEEAILPPVEVSESNGDVTVKMEVPGFEKDQIHVSVADDALTVRGEAHKEKEDEKKNYYRKEIRYGAFQRTVPLPLEVDAGKAKADLKNGVLTLTLPKSKAPKANEIKIAVN